MKTIELVEVMLRVGAFGCFIAMVIITAFAVSLLMLMALLLFFCCTCTTT
mgnify:CR=1 FL=1